MATYRPESEWKLDGSLVYCLADIDGHMQNEATVAVQIRGRPLEDEWLLAEEIATFLNSRARLLRTAQTKLVCRECDMTVAKGDPVRYVSDPMASSEIEWMVCGNCHSPDSYIVACDEEGCWEQSTMGTPTLRGYRRTCWKHRPQ